MINVKSNLKTAIKKGGPVKTGEKKISVKGLDVIIVSVLAAIFFFCPLFFVGLAAQGLGFEKMIFFYLLVLVGIVAWVTKGVIVGELKIKRTPLDWPIVAMVIIFAVSTILSISSQDSLIGSYGNSAKSLVAVIIFSLFYYLLVNNLNIKRIKLMFWSVISGSSLAIIYAFLQLRGIYLLPLSVTHNQGFNSLGSLSALTMFLVISLPLLVVAIAKIKKIAPRLNIAATITIKIILGLVTLTGLIILALLNGFTFWPVAIVGIVIVLMFFLARIIPISTNNLLIPLSVFLILIILLVLGNFNIINLKLPAEVSLSRGASWDIAKNSLRENPIFGSGPSTFYYDFSKFKSLAFNASPLWNVRFDSASGAIFELLATVGVLGALSIIILALIGLSMSFLALIKTEREGENSILLSMFASFVSALLFAVLFAENNSLILITLLISILTIAITIVIYPEKFKELKLSFRSSAKYALALAAIFLCVSAGVVVLFTLGLKMYTADVYARQAIMEQKPEKKVAKLNRAIALAPYQDNYYLILANSYMSLSNQAALKNDQNKIQDYLSLAIQSGRKAVNINPNKAADNESLGLIYENASFYTRGALEWAETLYKKEIELDPNNPTPYLRIALINMARANAQKDKDEKKYDINEAIKKYDEAITKKSNFAAAYYGKSIAYEKLNNLDKAIEQLKKANLIDRNNIDYHFELGRLYFNRGVKQPNLTQTESKKITENDITPKNESATSTSSEKDLSVKPNQPATGVLKLNSDLDTARQIFLSILAVKPNHVNSLYSLATLYKKVGDDNNAKITINKLLKILPDKKTKDIVRQQFKDVL